MRCLTLVGLAVVLLATAFGSWSCFQEGFKSPAKPITVAYSPFESTALFWVATDQEYFAQNGVSITKRSYDSGAGALAGMLKGEADIVMGTTEFPVAVSALRKEKLRIIGTMDKGDFVYLIGRKDRGIEKATDLKGKRVGTTIGTVAQFHLGRLLNLNGLRMEDISLVDLKTPDEWINAAAGGDVDAVVIAQPYANAARDRLGANATFLPAQYGQPLYALIISTDEWMTKNPGLAQSFLKSLVQAEEYASGNSAGAKAIVQKGLKLDAAYMQTVWAQNQFALTLDQSLILAMENEVRWIIMNNLTTEKQVPNFLDYIAEDALRVVKPGVVSIIR